MQGSLSRPLALPRKPMAVPLLALLMLLVLVLVLAIGVGSVYIAPIDVLRALGHGFTGQLANANDTIIWQLRLPRALLAALVGAALALAGATFQALFRNPLADPYLLGAASGAGFGATLVMISGLAMPLLFTVAVPLAAFVFASLAVFMVVFLAKDKRGIPLVALILAGVVVGSSLSAATSFMMLLAREQAVGILSWLLGSFAFASWQKVAVIAPFVLVSFLLMLRSSRALNLLQLGEMQALQLGLSVEQFKLGMIAVATLATAAAVSVSGIIGFVGLIIPHAVRLAQGPDYRKLLPLSALAGALFMVLADLVARTVIAPNELPIGVITALVGGPFFLYLLKWRGQKL